VILPRKSSSLTDEYVSEDSLHTYENCTVIEDIHQN